MNTSSIHPIPPVRFRLFRHVLAFLLMGMLTGQGSLEAAEAISIKALPDLQYAEVGGKKLMLDLYLPEGVKNPPLIVYIHGGGWRAGKRHKKGSLDFLLNNGFAIASIDYRLSGEAVFPAQIQDCKGAVRWLRAHAEEYGYDGSRIAAYGSSAGGHLALLLGLTSGNARLEGDVGGHLQQPSDVRAVVDFFGPTDLSLMAKDQPWEAETNAGFVYQLLGGPVSKNREMAGLASPVQHVSTGDSPLLVFHGAADRTILPNQSERLRDACVAAGTPMEFHRVEGAGHGDPDPGKAKPGTDLTVRFATPENNRLIIDFLRSNLK